MEKRVTTPETATLRSRVIPTTTSVTQVAQLADQEVRVPAARELEDALEGGAHARQPAQAGVEHADQADDPDGRGGALDRADGDLPGGPGGLGDASVTIPGRTSSIAVDQVVLGVREDPGEVADREERQRQDREEGQEGEVGDGPGLRRAVDLPVVLLHPDQVVDQRATARGHARAPPSPEPAATASAPGPVRAKSWVAFHPWSASWT